MKYLKKFENHSAYAAAESGLILPNVSYCVQENEVHYNPIHDYSKDYLTFVIKTSGTFEIYPDEANNVYYSLDNGETWVDFSRGGDITVSAGDKLMWKGTLSSGSGARYWEIEDKEIVYLDVQGNIMSLMYGDNFKGQTDLTDKGFDSLFSEWHVENAENLILPATTLTESCYQNMFKNCISLGTAPKLPATTLAKDCYRGMFEGCTSLVNAPALPATELTYECYIGMFYGCTSLVNAPVLPATTLAEACYNSMFYDCTSLTTAPELPATILAVDCYGVMFTNCTSLTTAPALPASTLTEGCYGGMFQSCTSLNYIKAMFTTAPSTTYTQNWVSGVSASGTFVKNSAAEWDVSGANGIPTGWTVETASA